MSAVLPEGEGEEEEEEVVVLVDVAVVKEGLEEVLVNAEAEEDMTSRLSLSSMEASPRPEAQHQ